MLDTIQVFQLGDMCVTQHTKDWSYPDIRGQGRPDMALDSYRVFLPHSPYSTQVRDLELKLVLYATDGRGRDAMLQQLASLSNRNIDIIAAQILSNANDVGRQNTPNQLAGPQILWLHTIGRIADYSAEMGRANAVEVRLDLELSTFWSPLNPAIWLIVPRSTSQPSTYSKTTFEETDITSFPRMEAVFFKLLNFAFHRRSYADVSFFYDPDYFSLLPVSQSSDHPRERYATDWAVDISNQHYIAPEKTIWSAPPLSLYLFKNLTTATTISVEVTRQKEIWEVEIITTTIDVTAIDTAMTAAGFTLLDTDILVMGDVIGGAHIRRNGNTILSVEDAISFDGGDWAGQLLPGENIVKVRGGTFAQHHEFRRF